MELRKFKCHSCQEPFTARKWPETSVNGPRSRTRTHGIDSTKVPDTFDVAARSALAGGRATRALYVLADLLEARHEDGRPLSDDEVRDAVITSLVAGHETSTIALAWIFEQVSRE
jgi:cytochrome P450